MSFYIKAYACTDNTSELFQKHLKVVKFCIDNELSLPIETEDYFRNGLREDFEYYTINDLYDELKDGFKTYLGSDQQYFEIECKDIPKDANKIIIRIEC